MIPTLFAWLPFAMIGLGFIFILVCAIGISMIVGRARPFQSDTGRYGVPYIPQDVPAKPGSPIPFYPQDQMQGQWVDPVTGQPVAPPTLIPPMQNNATSPSPTTPAFNGASRPGLIPSFCPQCGFPLQLETQQFCPRCGAQRTG